MLDIKYIRQEPDEVKKRLIARGDDPGSVDELLTLDKKRRALVTETENLQAERNAASKEIGGFMGQGKIAEAEANTRTSFNCRGMIKAFAFRCRVIMDEFRFAN